MLPQTPVAVLAGTPVDTQMGVRILEEAGIATLPFPLSANPIEQTVFQIASQEEKAAALRAVFRSAKDAGCGKVCVYCNSLSSAIDIPPLAEELGLWAITPLDIYRALAPQYRRLGLISANAQGLAGIERVMCSVNPSLDLLGVCALPAVLSIEAGESPEALVEHHHLTAVADWFEQCGMEALVLGCTHFPYFKETLAARTRLPLIDPTEEMVRRILA